MGNVVTVHTECLCYLINALYFHIILALEITLVHIVTALSCASSSSCIAGLAMACRSAAHGSEKSSLASVSDTELGVSTADVSSVLSSPSCMSSSLEKEDRDRALPRVELEHDVCLFRDGLYSWCSPCSATDSGRRGDVGSDPLLAKAEGGIRRRNAVWREGGE
jgi:hypothetical protein